MNKELLAQRLSGREYMNEITKDEESLAKKAGLVVVFGCSDDLAEFKGAIYDEIGAYGGRAVRLNKKGLIKNECDDDDCPYFRRLSTTGTLIEIVWNKDGYSWTYKTEIPHATFEVMEDREPYCRGIVFALEDV